jgi:hypothetical protein
MGEFSVKSKLLIDVKFSNLTCTKSSIMQFESQLSLNFNLRPANTEDLDWMP